MANLFDSANYPIREPAELVVGDRWTWKRSDLGADYPPADYALSYSARMETSGSEIAISASESGSDYLVEVPAATTAAYAAGIYHWQAYITRSSDSERVVVDSGSFEVKANRASATGDPRGHVKRVLDAIEAVIEGRAAQDQEEISINGRSLKHTPVGDLLILRDRYRSEYRREQAAERLRNGLGSSNTIRVRF